MTCVMEGPWRRVGVRYTRIADPTVGIAPPLPVCRCPAVVIAVMWSLTMRTRVALRPRMASRGPDGR